MNCKVCGTVVPPISRSCPGCGSDAGFPNVRLASSAAEKDALDKRLIDATVSAKARSCDGVLEAFGVAASKSHVVIARNLGVVHDLVKADSQLYINFYKQVASGARFPEDNAFDKGRFAADSIASPFYFQDISYGALSLNGRGVSHFGKYFVVLRENMIELRTTVFEENPFLFCQKQKIVATQSCPLGFRATWLERGKLSKAKLHSKMTSSTTDGQFANILLNDTGDEHADFVEAHVYGAISKVAIERVVGPRPQRGADLAIWKSVEGSILKLGGSMEII